jgi:ABC-type branched-subunit amino acid transport system ATPase component
MLLPMLELRAVRKAFGGVVANDAISLSVPRGSVVGLIGPNGSGKTTLFNSITGHHRIDGGAVRFDGRELRGLSVAQIARLGLVHTFQQGEVYDGMTCLQSMQISMPHSGEGFSAMWRTFPAELTQRALELLAFVGLREQRHTPAAELSYGERKLLEFAMGLANEPKMLLLDEPTAGVHPKLIDHMVDRLRRANAALGVTLFIIEHNMRVVMGLAQRIYCLANGRLLASGTADEIRTDPRVLEAYLGAG